jgi:uroporphyrinogen decarboxylase
MNLARHDSDNTQEGYTSAHRLLDALNHREPQGIPFDLGGTKVTGIHIEAYKNLMYTLYGEYPEEIPLVHFTQQLAEPDTKLLDELGVDTMGLFGATPPGKTSTGEQGEYYTCQDEWNLRWKMPKSGGLYYDMFYHPLSGTDYDIEGFDWPLGADPHRFDGLGEQLVQAKSAGKGIVLGGVCAGILEMSMWLRGFEDFLLDLALDPEAACGLMDRILGIKLAYWDTALDKFGDHILVAQEADDLGTQTSSLVSPDMYRKLIKPRHKKLFDFIKQKTAGKTKVFLHSCGNIYELIPDLIDAGVDILNPVQVSATGMETARLKREFGDALTFWGGGIDTQSVLPHGSSQEVKDEVRRRIDDLAPEGGFVFTTVHNIQADVPPENILAMIEALDEFR